MVSSSVLMAVIVVACADRVQAKANEFMLPCDFPKEKNDNDDLRRLLPLINLTFAVRDSVTALNESYNYTVGICTNVGPISTDKAAVVQRRMDGLMKPEYFVVGRYTDCFVKSGSRWILLEFRSGDKYASACGKSNRVANIMFMCNDAVNDFSQVAVVEENVDLETECYYMIEVQHCLACEDGCDSYYRRFSPGSIILISLFSLVAAYLLFGFLYMRCIAKATGWEQIPNYHFWREIGHLQSDGCTLVCRCRAGDSAHSYYEPTPSSDQLHSAISSSNGYRGVGIGSGSDATTGSTSLLEDHDPDERLLAL